MDMANAFYNSCVLFTASDLGIFAFLSKNGPANKNTIAKACGLDSHGARLLLDACTALDLLTKNGLLYDNTDETAAFLVPGTTGDLSKAIRYNRDVYDAWGHLAKLAKTGKPVERPDIHLGDDKERTRDFVLSMHGRAMGIGQAVVPLLDMKGKHKLLDIGGGPGTYSVLIARKYPEIDCTVIDLPEVTKVASELIDQAGMSKRVHCLPGDYHKTNFPPENDVINIFGVLHQESPESIQDILKRSSEALAPGGIINILDMMTDETRCHPVFSALFAVNMALTAENGWVFSNTDLKEWLQNAGFENFKCSPLPPPMPHWLATARKAEESPSVAR